MAEGHTSGLSSERRLEESHSGPVPQDAVREELQRILSGHEFRSSKRSQEFLRYVVDHTLSGAADTLKERTIGIDVFGRTVSYETVAKKLGSPTAVRAVARANGTNRLYLLVPCHRVIAKDGSLSGYGGGVWRKYRLIELEQSVKQKPTPTHES